MAKIMKEIARSAVHARCYPDCVQNSLQLWQEPCLNISQSLLQIKSQSVQVSHRTWGEITQLIAMMKEFQIIFQHHADNWQDTTKCFLYRKVPHCREFASQKAED